MITKEHLEDIGSLLNPVIFTNTCMPKFVPDGLRKFQEEILSCRKKQVVMRIGRRSGKTHLLACKAVFEALSNEHYRVAVITPTEEQGRVLFDMITNRILNVHDDLKNCIVSITKSPGKIKFKCGSWIHFFTAGTRTGSGALNVRGQGADLIIIDEADYLSSSDLESILALKIEHKDIVIWASSTPTGRRSHFYQWCTNRALGWHPYHYGSPEAIPDWDAETENFARKNFPGDSYEREIMANFGTEQTGVFNKKKLDKACKKGEGLYITYPLHLPFYGYMQTPTYFATRTIGVDWDKYGSPTNLIVLELKDDGTFMVVNRTQVERSEFTLTNAVNKLIELNEIWRPQYIYIDRGFGEVQAEILKLYGKKHKDTLLDKIVRPISFSSRITILDPITHLPEKKEAKHLMVNLLQRTIEDEKLILNARDLTMTTQLIDYCVERIGISGKPIFSTKDDHCVDAICLAHFGMIQNNDILFKNDSKAYVNFKKSAMSLFDGKQGRNNKYSSMHDFLTDRVNNRYTSSNHDYKRFGTQRPVHRNINFGRVKL